MGVRILDPELQAIDNELGRLVAEGADLAQLRAIRWRRRQRVQFLRSEKRRAR
jgi:hypothetical protein